MRSLAIVGRPNVGKSALFNRLAKQQISIVHDQEGVTRDRISAVCKLGKKPFEIVDTGGIGAEPDPDFAESTHEAAEIAIESSDVLLFVVDGQNGLTPLDQDLSKKMRSAKRPVILVVNKVDTDGHTGFMSDFGRLGFANVVDVSAAHGRGIEDLVELVESLMPASDDDVPLSDQVPKLAIVGRPNVGKSSLINAILEDKRAIVSDIAGTTRDAVDISYTRDGQQYILCDTAGIRHRSRHNSSVEVFSVMRSEKTIERADLCVLVIDATMGPTTQDKKIGGLIQQARKPAIIVLNKWDLINPGKEDPALLREHVETVRRELFFLSYAPVVVLSAKTGENVQRLFSMIEKIRQHATRRVGTGELNRMLKTAMERQSPPARSNKRFKMLYATQVNAEHFKPFPTPQFLLFVNDPRLLPDSYLNYLVARLREHWEYPGLPVWLKLRGREKKDDDQ